jgi:lipopolysaccharide export system protein LptA
MHLLPAPKSSAPLFPAVARLVCALLLSSTLVSVSFSALALPSDRSQTIKLEADLATYNEKTGVSSYSGNVIIQQGTIKIQADSIVTASNKKNEIQKVTAKGKPARFQQQISAEKGLARGEGQTIVYNADTGLITLSGNAYLTQNGNTVRSDTLTYSLNAGDVEARGNSERRVQFIIQPAATQTTSKARTR